MSFNLYQFLSLSLSVMMLIFLFVCLFSNFIFKLYIIVLVLPNIKMNPPMLIFLDRQGHLFHRTSLSELGCSFLVTRFRLCIFGKNCQRSDAGTLPWVVSGGT